jgi:hypothetical protein
LKRALIKKPKPNFNSSDKRFKEKKAEAPPIGIYDPKYNLTIKRSRKCMFRPRSKLKFSKLGGSAYFGKTKGNFGLSGKMPNLSSSAVAEKSRQKLETGRRKTSSSFNKVPKEKEILTKKML